MSFNSSSLDDKRFQNHPIQGLCPRFIGLRVHFDLKVAPTRSCNFKLPSILSSNEKLGGVLYTISFANPKLIVIPAPLRPFTIQTPGSTSITKSVLPGNLGYTPCQVSAITAFGNWAKVLR